MLVGLACAACRASPTLRRLHCPHTPPLTPLAVGELPRELYARLRAAGADRYLLRIESSNPELYASIHPPAQKWESRVRCLRDLKDLGFMVREEREGCGGGCLGCVGLVHRCRVLFGAPGNGVQSLSPRHSSPPPCPAPDWHGRDGGAAWPDAARPGGGCHVLPGPGRRHDWHGGCNAWVQRLLAGLLPCCVRTPLRV